MMSILELKNVVKMNGQTRILNSVSLTVNERERVLIYGPAGCGAEALMRVLGGLEKPDFGDITLPKIMGFVPQNDGLIRELTLAENIALPMRLQGKNEGRKLSRCLLDFLDILYAADAKPAKCTPFERKSAAIGRSMIHSPELVIVHELTAGFSERESEILTEKLHRLLTLAKSAAIVFASTDADKERFDRVFNMKFGTIEEV